MHIQSTRMHVSLDVLTHPQQYMAMGKKEREKRERGKCFDLQDSR